MVTLKKIIPAEAVKVLVPDMIEYAHIPFFSLNTTVKPRQNDWLSYLKTLQRKSTPASRPGKNTGIQNSTTGGTLTILLSFQHPLT